MIFMTSNLGASQMSSILKPGMGFAAAEVEHDRRMGVADERLEGKITRAGEEAARRKFTPEFMNRLDKIVVFRPLGEPELRRILEIELNLLQRRVFESTGANSFVFNVTDDARDHLLSAGTDMKYGARHLKRAIERLIVQPLSNLVATCQLRGGDLVKVDFDHQENRLFFFKEAEGIALQAMAEMTGSRIAVPAAATIGATAEPVKTTSARSSRRG
jgi:ATP-dependent Clp protease ATP-binding subunit ClpA